MFVDNLYIVVRAGNGGSGSVHWRREKYITHGGPNGGDGGKGGDIYIQAVRDIGILARYNKKPAFSAQNGGNGSKSNKKGKNGENIIINVPLGSIITNTQTNEVFDMTKIDEKILVAAGGQGGYGNDHYKSSRNTTPTEFTYGTKGQEYRLHIELRLLVDAGFIGFPNAGKSTLLNTLTNASAKIGSYPFTTLSPNLGVYHEYVMVDIPGIIEGASEGKGIGHSFLRHISRAKILVHLISLDEYADDPYTAYITTRKELELFSQELLEKQELVFLTKKDIVSDEVCKHAQEKLQKKDIHAECISAYDDNISAVGSSIIKAIQS